MGLYPREIYKMPQKSPETTQHFIGASTQQPRVQRQAHTDGQKPE